MKDNNISKELSRIKTPEKSKERIYKEIIKIVNDKEKKKNTVWVLPAIAAAVVVVAITPLILNGVLQTNPEETAKQAGIIDKSNGNLNENSIKTGEAVEPNRPIIEGANGSMNQIVPNPGEVLITPALIEEMKIYDYEDVLFHVDIIVYYDIKDSFKYEGKTLDEYRNDPALVRYREEHNIWREEIYIQWDKEMTAAEERGEEYAQGWWKHSEDELFEEYWHKTQPEDVIAAYELAREQYDKAIKAYEEWLNSPDGAYTVTLEQIKKECGRLNALGYDLEVKDEKPAIVIELTGYLTRRQIEGLAANERFGYIIKWADGVNVMNA